MRLLSLILFFNFIFYSSFSLSNENNIKLGLDWFINPDHAPIIIAKPKYISAIPDTKNARPSATHKWILGSL